VLSAHRGGGETLRPMPLEITRCLCVPGAELAPPPPVRRGPGCVVAADTPWPNGQACHSCGRRRLVRLLVADGAFAGAILGTSSLPGLGASCTLRGLQRLWPPVEGVDFPFFPSPWQASHCSRVRCNFPPTVIGP
jgi:hypothetical protein